MANLPVSLEAWNKVLFETGNADRLEDFLNEPDHQQRREHIRDIYDFLNAQQLVRVTQQLQSINQSLDQLRAQREKTVGDALFSWGKGLMLFGLGVTSVFLFQRIQE